MREEFMTRQTDVRLQMLFLSSTTLNTVFIEADLTGVRVQGWFQSATG